MLTKHKNERVFVSVLPGYIRWPIKFLCTFPLTCGYITEMWHMVFYLLTYLMLATKFWGNQKEFLNNLTCTYFLQISKKISESVIPGPQNDINIILVTYEKHATT